MKKINILQLKNDKWKLNMTTKRRIYNSPALIYQAVERYIKSFFVRTKQLKTCVKVKYLDRSTNESLPSNNVNYLLYTLSCFLEDHLPKITLKRAERKYNEK